LTLDSEQQVFGEAKKQSTVRVDARSLEHGLALSKKECKWNLFPIVLLGGAENLPIWTFELLHDTK